MIHEGKIVATPALCVNLQPDPERQLYLHRTIQLPLDGSTLSYKSTVAYKPQQMRYILILSSKSNSPGWLIKTKIAYICVTEKQKESVVFY